MTCSTTRSKTESGINSNDKLLNAPQISGTGSLLPDKVLFIARTRMHACVSEANTKITKDTFKAKGIIVGTYSYT